MAGFDFTISILPKERDIARHSLAVVQKHAKALKISFKYRWKKELISQSDYYYITVDGSLVAIEQLYFITFDTIPVFCKGFVKCRSVLKKSNIGETIPFSLFKAISKFKNEIKDFIKEGKNTLQTKFIINTLFFDKTHIPALDKQLENLTFCISVFRTYCDKVIAEQLIELFHTVTELMLAETTVSKTSKLTYEQLAVEAFKINVLDAESRDLLIDLKNMRKKAKHRGKIISDNELMPMLNKLITICQILVIKIITLNHIL